MRGRRKAEFGFALAATLLAAAPARASWQDLYGFGSRSMGLAGAATAAADDYSAVYYNPANLMIGRGFSTGLGRTELFNDLRLSGGEFNRSNADVSGTQGGLSLRQRWFDALHLGFGAGFFIPDQGVIKVQNLTRTEPRAVLLQNRSQRVTVNFAGAMELLPGLYAGGGFSLFADLTGDGVNVEASLARRTAVADVGIDINTKLSPIAGVLWEPVPRLRIGASWRGEQDISLGLTTRATLGVDPGEPPPVGDLNLVALIGVDQAFFWTPNEVSGGVSLAATEDLTLTADLAWYQWSKFPEQTPRLILEASGVLGSLLPIPAASPAFDVKMNDRFVPRFGIEWWAFDLPYVDVALRGGYAYFDSPVSKSDRFVAYLDTDRHLLAAGVEFLIDDPYGLFLKPAALNLNFMTILHETRKERVGSATSLIGDVKYGGEQYVLGAELILEF